MPTTILTWSTSVHSSNRLAAREPRAVCYTVPVANAWTILHAGALGDLVLTIQLALRLADAHGGGEHPLRVISRASPGDLSGCRPAFSRLSSDSAGLHWAYARDDSPAPPALREAVADRRVLAALGAPDSPACARLRTLMPKSFHSFEPAAQPGVVRHITEQWATQLEGQGLLLPKCVRHRGTVSVRTPQWLPARGRMMLDAALARRLHDCGTRPVCVLHPGSGGARKCWPVTAFVALARSVRQYAEVAVLFGPAEAERGVVAEFREAAAEVVVLLSDDADDLAAILASADVFVGNDAGPTHLAALLGTPTLALFGPSLAEVWRPLGSDVEVVRGDPQRDAATWGLNATDIAERVARALDRRHPARPAAARGGEKSE